MGLIDVLNNFSLKKKERKDLSKEDQFTALQEPPQEFKEVAKAILSGHFLVENATDDDVRRVYPTCIEIYYHEEQDNGVKDPIIYHRNRKKKSGNDSPGVFPLGVLHNHVSGIDITFEKDANAVTGVVRASALIREFMVKDKDGNIIKAVKNGKESDTDDRSTYLYQALFGQFSIFDGFTIKWEDDKEKDLDNIKLLCKYRKNVMKYENPHSGEYDYHKTDIQCNRAWQFLIDNTNK